MKFSSYMTTALLYHTDSDKRKGPRRLKKWVLSAVAVIIGGGTAAFLLLKSNTIEQIATATVLTASPSPTATFTPTSTPTATSTFTATPTATATLTSTPSITPTLATLVLRITAVNPDVTVAPPPSATIYSSPTPLPTANVPLPPGIIPVADTGLATLSPGWVRYETGDSRFNYAAGRWYVFHANRATAQQYSYTSDTDARVILPFEGAGLRVRYVSYSVYGIFEVWIDGRVVATIDSYSPHAVFESTDIFGLTQGSHTVEIVNTGRKNLASAGYMLALDSVEVYQGIPSTNGPSATPQPTATFTPSPVRAQSIKLIAAPPTLAPTNTPSVPQLVAASLIIAYDENGNNAIDPNEGVLGISVRLVRIGSNEVVASGLHQQRRLRSAGNHD